MAYLFILIGALLRVLPHPANFAPIGAIALFGGTYLSRKQAIFAVIASMLISDFFLGFDSIGTRLMVYGSLLVGVLLGFWIKKEKSAERIVASSLLTSVVFFLVTNLVFVHPEPLYPSTWPGQLSSYTNGLPFFKWTLMSDLFYTSIFFTAYELSINYFKSWRLNRARRKTASMLF